MCDEDDEEADTEVIAIHLGWRALVALPWTTKEGQEEVCILNTKYI